MGRGEEEEERRNDGREYWVRKEEEKEGIGDWEGRIGKKRREGRKGLGRGDRWKEEEKKRRGRLRGMEEWENRRVREEDRLEGEGREGKIIGKRRNMGMEEIDPRKKNGRTEDRSEEEKGRGRNDGSDYSGKMIEHK